MTNIFSLFIKSPEILQFVPYVENIREGNRKNILGHPVRTIFFFFSIIPCLPILDSEMGCISFHQLTLVLFSWTKNNLCILAEIEIKKKYNA